jgi:hypothetical protein
VPAALTFQLLKQLSNAQLQALKDLGTGPHQGSRTPDSKLELHTRVMMHRKPCSNGTSMKVEAGTAPAAVSDPHQAHRTHASNTSRVAQGE